MDTDNRKPIRSAPSPPHATAIILLLVFLFPSVTACGRRGGGGTGEEGGKSVLASVGFRYREARRAFRLARLSSHLSEERWEPALRLLERIEADGDFPGGGEDSRSLRRDTANRLNERADVQRGRNSWSEALPLSDLAVRFDPTWPDAWWNRGECLARLGREAEAETDFRKALALDPANIGACHAYARFLENRKRSTEAVGLWSRFLELQPDSIYGLEARGDLRVEVRDYAGAVADLEKACSLGSVEGCRRAEELRRFLPARQD